MNDREIELQFSIIEEKHNNATSRLESRLSELNSDFRSYKESHYKEHVHEEKEIDLKIDLLRKEIEILTTKLDIEDKKQNKSISKGQLKFAIISLVVASLIGVAAITIQVFDIKLNSKDNGEKILEKKVKK